MARRRISTRTASPGDGADLKLDKLILIEVGTDLHSEYLTWTDKSVVELGAPHLMPSHIDRHDRPNCTSTNSQNAIACYINMNLSTHMATISEIVCVCVFRLRQHVYHLLKRRIPCKAWTQREWKAAHGCMTLFRIASWKKVPRLWW